LHETRAYVERALEAALPAPDARAPRLAEALRHSVFAGGKRLRPILAVASAEAAGGARGDALPYAVALELVHTYSLIHDDLPAMDDDDFRRGVPTSHKQFGEALAILAGDALHTLAFEVLLTGTSDAERARRLGIELAAAAGCAGMVGGQVADIVSGTAAPDAETLEHIHRGKTAALLRAATRGGGIAVGASDETCADLGNYGMALGLAFQVIDDVLDEVGEAADLGKTPGKDRAQGKLTAVSLEGVPAARARAEGHRAAALAALDRIQDGHPESVARLRHLAEFVLRRDH
jgi:geranylgeranyl diphosphate synthase type II